MNKDEVFEVIGFSSAVPGWYVLDHDPGVKPIQVSKCSIVGWLFTMQQLAVPVSPEFPLQKMPATTMMVGPDGRVFNRLHEAEWASIEAYVESLNS